MEGFADQCFGFLGPIQSKERLRFAPVGNVLKSGLLVFRGGVEGEVEVPNRLFVFVRQVKPSADRGIVAYLRSNVRAAQRGRQRLADLKPRGRSVTEKKGDHPELADGP